MSSLIKMTHSSLIAASVSAILSALVCFLATGKWIRTSEERGIVARDLHKPGEVLAARIGGVPLALAFSIQASVLSILTGTPASLVAIPIFLSSLGLTDDLIGLNNTEKIILAGLPFLLSDSFPKFEPFSSLLTHQLTLFLLGTYFVNSTNTYAGFNGLEAGNSLVISLALSIFALIKGELAGFLYFLSLSLLLLSFLKYNWYPARAFPGNVMTFLCGGALASAAFQFGLYWQLVLLSLPQGIDFSLKLLSWGRTRRKVPAGVSDEGKLIPPPNLSLPSLLIRLGVREEKKLVACLLTTELLIASLLLIYLPR